ELGADVGHPALLRGAIDIDLAQFGLRLLELQLGLAQGLLLEVELVGQLLGEVLALPVGRELPTAELPGVLAGELVEGHLLEIALHLADRPDPRLESFDPLLDAVPLLEQALVLRLLERIGGGALRTPPPPLPQDDVADLEPVGGESLA